MPRMKQEILKELQSIPGIGPSISQDLWALGTRLDRCLLYVFRCAVYYASHTKHDPDKLKWWKWKD